MGYQIIERSALNLSAKVDPLIEDVEKLFGRPVVFAMMDDLLHAEAMGAVDVNGAPFVGMMPHGCREITIVHELLHLECEAHGFPRTRSELGTAKLPPAKVSNLIGEWFSIVEHQIIYPKMEMLGYDPSGDMELKFRNKLLSALKNKTQFLKMNPNRDILFADLVTQITRGLTEGRRTLRRDIIKTMNTTFPKELKISIRLAEQIKLVKNRTPQEVRAITEECLEVIGIPKIGIYTYDK